jgi:hypothetical protein
MLGVLCIEHWELAEGRMDAVGEGMKRNRGCDRFYLL